MSNKLDAHSIRFNSNIMKGYNTMKKDRYQIITDTVIEQMENLGSDWMKSWSTNAMSGHHNIVSKKAYQGTNTFLLYIPLTKLLLINILN